MEIIHIQEKEKWNFIVKSFPDWDVYYLNEYVFSLKLHGDGIPYLVYHKKGETQLCYIMMQNDIANFTPLSKHLERDKYYDWTTPYGYGGPLIKGTVSSHWINEFMDELIQWCNMHSIISQFFRFHPLLQNQAVLEDVCDVVHMKETVYMDTIDKDTIYKNMTPNNRNMVRKAEKNGVQITIDKGEKIEEFIKIYQTTMKQNNADDYYYFENDYFNYLINNFSKNLIFFYATYQDTPVSASIFLYNSKFIHYHLSGTLPMHRSLGANNLILTEAANWAAERGITKFHLGGGVGTDDSLLFFKKQLNRRGLVDFYIGRTIFNKEIFNELIELRKKYDRDFDASKKFLIKYRG